MKTVTNLFLIFLSVFSTSLLAEDCSRLIGSCDYYLCREQQHHCGVKGYYMGFGYKYCIKSEQKLNPKMSERGKAWSTEVAECLQKKADTIPYDDNCTDVSETSFQDHPECYRDSGFCSLSHRDQLKVINMIKSELRHPQIIKQGLAILSECQ